MLRRFAPDHERPAPDQVREWHVGNMFDKEGTPVDVETGLIIQQFLDSPNAAISAMIVSRRTHLNPFLVRSYCRQMCNPCINVLEELPPLGNCFQLNTNTTDLYAQELIGKIRQTCSKYQ
ncbi:MAG: hypothetical protein PHU04_02205 [Candidatus Peribacteraceae bacterium]|nr:hypothetical protein [Candidatus Peribacteraceae bacterium]